jgi:hypothetical protein
MFSDKFIGTPVNRYTGASAVNQGYKYYCRNKVTGVEQWLDSPCTGWKILKKERV